MNTIKKMMSLLTLFAVIITATPARTAVAATPGTVRIQYWATAMTYNYIGRDDYWHTDATKGVSFVGSDVSLNGKSLSSQRIVGTRPYWYDNDGIYLGWMEAAGNQVHNTITGITVCLPGSAGANLFEGDYGILGYVKLADGTKLTPEQAIAKLPGGIVPGGIVGSTPTPSPTATPTLTPSPAKTATPAPTKAPATTAKPVATPTVAPIVVTPAIQITPDMAGRTKYVYGKNTIIVDGATVYVSTDKVADIKISTLCDSGTQFVGITSEGVYLYEDASKGYYKFSFNNLFNPVKFKIADGNTLIGGKFDSNNFLVGIETKAGTFSLNQLVEDKAWKASFTYAINHPDYCQFYWAGTAGGHKVAIKDSNAYLDSSTTAFTGGVTAVYAKAEGPVVQKGTLLYKSTWDNPGDLQLWKQNVSEPKLSSDNGLVVDVNYLGNKVDYVDNTTTKNVWYQSGKVVGTVTLKTKKAQVFYDGRKIATIKKKSGYTYWIGVKEDGYIAYGSTDKSGKIISAKKMSQAEASKVAGKRTSSNWNVSSVSPDKRGFLVGK